MNCELANNLIVSRLDDDEVPADAGAALDAHLAECPACREVADELALQDVELGRAFAARRAAADAIAERVILAVQSEQVAPVRARTPWREWGRLIVAAAAGFALAVVLMRPWNARPTDNASPVPAVTTVQPVVAQLTLATGKVWTCASASKDWRPLENGEAVGAGTKVRTAENARCELRMTDGSEVRLNATTEVTLASHRRVDLAGGQVFSNVRPATEAFILSASPPGTTLSASGTFDVACSPRTATLTVVDGSVKLASPAGDHVIRGGEAITLTDGRAAEKRPVESPTRATQWVDQILVLKGRDNPELARRIDDIFAQLGHEKMWYLRAQEVRALGDRCVIPLTRYIQSERSKNPADANKRREAARIVSDVATTWAIPELINLLADDDGEVRFAASRALDRLTGQNQGRTPDAWRDEKRWSCTPAIEQWHDWWAKNKTRFPGADPDAVKPLELSKEGSAPTKG